MENFQFDYTSGDDGDLDLGMDDFDGGLFNGVDCFSGEETDDELATDDLNSFIDTALVHVSEIYADEDEPTKIPVPEPNPPTRNYQQYDHFYVNGREKETFDQRKMGNNIPQQQFVQYPPQQYQYKSNVQNIMPSGQQRQYISGHPNQYPPQRNVYYSPPLRPNIYPPQQFSQQSTTQQIPQTLNFQINPPQRQKKPVMMQPPQPIRLQQPDPKPKRNSNLGKRKPVLPNYLPKLGTFRLQRRQTMVKVLQGYGTNYNLNLSDGKYPWVGLGQPGIIYESRSDCISTMIIPIPWNEMILGPLQLQHLFFRFELERSHYYKGKGKAIVVPNTTSDRWTQLFKGENAMNVFAKSRYIKVNPKYEIIDEQNSGYQSNPFVKHVRVTFCLNRIVIGKAKGINRIRLSVLDSRAGKELNKVEYFCKIDNRKETGNNLLKIKYFDYLDLKSIPVPFQGPHHQQNVKLHPQQRIKEQEELLCQIEGMMEEDVMEEILEEDEDDDGIDISQMSFVNSIGVDSFAFEDSLVFTNFPLLHVNKKEVEEKMKTKIQKVKKKKKKKKKKLVMSEKRKKRTVRLLKQVVRWISKLFSEVEILKLEMKSVKEEDIMKKEKLKEKKMKLKVLIKLFKLSKRIFLATETSEEVQKN